jgi:hypothetical protein
MGYRFCANSGEMMGVCGVFSGNGNTLPERGYSPSILEGVPEGRGSNTKHQKSL